MRFQWPTSLPFCRFIVSEANVGHMAEDGVEAAAASRAEAVGALLAADGGLKAALAEGLALFALAAANPAGVRRGAAPDAASAQQLAEALLAEVGNRREQVCGILPVNLGLSLSAVNTSGVSLGEALLAEVAARCKQVLHNTF